MHHPSRPPPYTHISPPMHVTHPHFIPILHCFIPISMCILITRLLYPHAHHHFSSLHPTCHFPTTHHRTRSLYLRMATSTIISTSPHTRYTPICHLLTPIEPIISSITSSIFLHKPVHRQSPAHFSHHPVIHVLAISLSFYPPTCMLRKSGPCTRDTQFLPSEIISLFGRTWIIRNAPWRP